MQDFITYISIYHYDNRANFLSYPIMQSVLSIIIYRYIDEVKSEKK